jgi:flagellar hook-associated protein 2
LAGNLRVGGLATGMDLEAIVKDLMRIERMRVDKLEQEKTLHSWRQEAYQEINRALAAFILETRKELGLTRVSSGGALLQQSVSSLPWVKKATAADSSVVEVSARADAAAGSYRLVVRELAANWSAASSDKISLGEGKSLAEQFGLNDDDVINFTITTNKGSVTINKSGLSAVQLEELVREINQSKIGVRAIYDAALDRFFLQTEETGAENTIRIEENSSLVAGVGFITGAGNLLKLQYLEEGEQKWLADRVQYGGRDALVDFGAAVGLRFSHNQFQINNINVQIKSLGSTQIIVDTDVEAVYGKITEFVNRYNELVDKINQQLQEKRHPDYPSLTREQKEAMSEREIELWEEKAKSGLLWNDPILSQILQRVRSGLYEEVQGSSGLYRLTEFGIETEGYVSGSRGGKLIIKEDKLKEAIRENPGALLELLFSQPDRSLTESAERRRQTGLVSRIYEDIIQGMKQVISKAGPGNDAPLLRNVDSRMLIDFVAEQGSISLLDRDLNRLDERIDRMNERLIRAENRYWAQFAALEKAINQMNAQAMWLSMQLGGWPGR